MRDSARFHSLQRWDHISLFSVTGSPCTCIVPFTSLGDIFDFQLLSVVFVLVMTLIILVYMVTVEIVKKTFFKRVTFDTG